VNPLESIYVVSLSIEDDKLSQWRAYSHGGGYALGFRSDALRSLAQSHAFELRKCSYDRDQHIAEADAIAASVLRQVQAIPAGLLTAMSSTNVIEPRMREFLYRIRRSMDEDLAIRAPVWKHSSLREEEEWRLVSTLQFDTADKVKFRPGRSAIIPYIELQFDVPDLVGPRGEILLLRRTVVGPCPEPELALGTLAQLFAAQKIVCPQFTISPTPYRHW